MSSAGRPPSGGAGVSAAEHTPPEPVPGSARYFALLYAPAPQRALLRLLMALADEISAGVARSLDHSVSHARLEWWRLEAERYRAGAAQHPWLRSRAAGREPEAHLDLGVLVQAAALDLAEGLQRHESAERLHGALFVTAAEALGAAPLALELRERLTSLGAFTRRSEKRAAISSADRAALEHSLAGLDAQPALAPLLIWAALAERHPERASPLRALTDNLRAWRIARRAALAARRQAAASERAAR